jgi:hypothetical protein
MAESEGASSQDDAEEHQRQRNVESDRKSAVGLRKAHKKNDDRKNQPNMVGFPDRTHGVRNDLPLFLFPAASEEGFQNSGAEVGPAQEAIKEDRSREKESDGYV